MAAVVVSLASLAACGEPGAGPAAAADISATPNPAPTSPWRPGLVGAPTPERVLLPRLGIDASLLPLHLGELDELVPPPYGQAGWYEAGPEPGEPGRAVIAGHVDSETGPDVFADLGDARAGDRIRVTLADRSTLSFLVQTVEIHSRARSPRLVSTALTAPPTCGSSPAQAVTTRLVGVTRTTSSFSRASNRDNPVTGRRGRLTPNTRRPAPPRHLQCTYGRYVRL